MEDLTGKVTQSQLTAAEFIQPMAEIQKVITESGQVLTNTDVNQLYKAIGATVATKVQALSLELVDGKKVYITSPDGGEFTMRTGLPVGTLNDDGGTFAGTKFTTGDGSSGMRRNYTEIVDGRWFGATGDGVTDDTSALGLARFAGVVELKAGTYLINSALSGLFITYGTVTIIGTGSIDKLIKYSLDKVNFADKIGINRDSSGVEVGKSQWYIEDNGDAIITGSNFTRAFTITNTDKVRIAPSETGPKAAEPRVFIEDDVWNTGHLRVGRAEAFESSFVGVSSMTRVGSTVTVVTTAPHGFPDGADVNHTGANEIEYNVTKQIVLVDPNTYTHQLTTTPATPATGTITSQHILLLDPNGGLALGRDLPAQELSYIELVRGISKKGRIGLNAFDELTIFNGASNNYALSVTTASDLKIGGNLLFDDNMNIDLRGTSLTLNTRIADSGGALQNVIAATSSAYRIFSDGRESARVDGSTAAGNTGFLLFDVDSGILQRVKVGANDSAVAGFRELMVDNV